MDKVELLAKEYISKVKACDECCAECFCIIQHIKTGRTPKNDCYKKVMEYIFYKADEHLVNNP